MSPSRLADQAASPGISYLAGPFRVRLRTSLRALIDLWAGFYADAEVVPPGGVHDARIEVLGTRPFMGLKPPRAVFLSDGQRPFEPFPLDHAFPLLEWGINWTIAMRAHQYLMLHAGVVEQSGRALILPAMPGSGKSTLSIALALTGWRLLSDEFGLIDPTRRVVFPLPRAVPLKNASIQVIREFSPAAQMGPVFPRTRKGDVCHVRPPANAILDQDVPALPEWIVFPRFLAGVRKVALNPLPKSLAFTRLAQNAFNYRLLGALGFDVLTALVRDCDCYSLEYGNLSDALSEIDGLASAASIGHA